MSKPAPAVEMLNESDGDALDRMAGEFNVSRDAVLKAIDIVGNRAADVADYLREWGAPGTTP